MKSLLYQEGNLYLLSYRIRFKIDLVDGDSRGYILEVFDRHFELPDLGPIGIFRKV